MLLPRFKFTPLNMHVGYYMHVYIHLWSRRYVVCVSVLYICVHTFLQSTYTDPIYACVCKAINCHCKHMQCLKTHPSIQVFDFFYQSCHRPLSWVGGIMREKKVLFIENGSPK